MSWPPVTATKLYRILAGNPFLLNKLFFVLGKVMLTGFMKVGQDLYSLYSEQARDKSRKTVRLKKGHSKNSYTNNWYLVCKQINT